MVETATQRTDVTVVGAITHTGETSGVPLGEALDPDRVAGPDGFEELCRRGNADAVVDFTTPQSTADYAARTAAYADDVGTVAGSASGEGGATGIAFVTGTTGLDSDARGALADAARRVPVLHASNFSRGVAAMRRAVRTAAAALPGYDVEVTETHHAGKRDAPSGTAETLVDDVERVVGESERRHGRVGEAPREAGEIGVHARRAGNVTGEHEVLLAGDDQTLAVTHRAGSREVFAAGALDAADWLAGRAPGRYTFDDVIGDSETQTTEGDR